MPQQEDRYVQQLRRVSDYLVTSGSPHAADLEEALRAFDATEGGAEERSELRRVASNIYPLIERRTLAAILSGSFRPGGMAESDRTNVIFTPTNLIAVLGFVLIAASLHWTYWSTRASAVIESLDSVLETQRSLNIEEIVHTRDLCEYQKAQLDDQDVYRFVEATREMAYYDTIWVSSRYQAQNLKLGFWPLAAQIRFARAQIGGLFADDPVDYGEPIRNLELTGDKACEFFAQSPADRTLAAQFRWYQASFQNLADSIPLKSREELFRGTGTASIVVLQNELKES